MFRPKAVPLLLAAVLAAPTTIAKPLPVEELSPVTQWTVDYSDDSCELKRGFGSMENMFVLKLERFAPSDGAQMVASGRQLGTFYDTFKNVRITFGADGYVDDVANALTGQLKDGTPTIFITRTRLAAYPKGSPNDERSSAVVTPEQEAAIREISLESFRGKRIVLKTGSLGPAMAEMRKCTDELVHSWGLDAEQQKRLLHGPIPKTSIASWLNRNDTSLIATDKIKQNLLYYRVVVDATGQPTQSKVQRSYSGKLFDKMICDQIMRRARFQPAVDVDGKPAPSYFLSYYRWMIAN